MKRSLLAGTGAILLIAAGGAIFLVSNLNAIVAGIVEKQGSEVTATEVAVVGVEISLREGRGEMAGLTIASPKGFATRQAFSLGGIVVDIDVESLRNDPIVIEEIRVLAPVVNAEVHRDGSSNIGALQRSVKEYSARFVHDGGRDAGGAADDQKRLRIKRFVFEEGRIAVDASDLGLEPQALELPGMQLDDIGGPQGALPAEIAQAVLGALTQKATTAVARAGIEDKARDIVVEEAEKQGKKLLGRIAG